MNKRARLATCLVLLVAGSARAQTLPSAQQSDPKALQTFTAAMAGFKDVRTLESRFVCQKRVVNLDEPLVSAGRIWIARGAPEESKLRLMTQRPYVSELVFAGGKAFARSQHERDWTITHQAVRPGLTAVMRQLAGWSTGDVGGLAGMYALTIPEPGARVPAIPGDSEEFGKGAELFILTPVSRDLALAVKQVTVAIEPADGAQSGIPQLIFAEIVTAQDDTTRYWFFGGKVNPQFPPDAFDPAGAGKPGKAAADKSP